MSLNDQQMLFSTKLKKKNNLIRKINTTKKTPAKKMQKFVEAV